MTYHIRESDKHFLLSLVIGTGIIMFWKGLWEGLGSLPLLENPWVDLFIGLVILTFTGIIFQQFDPLGSMERAALKVMHNVHQHPQKHQFTLSYRDRFKKRDVHISAKNITHIEKNTISIRHKGKEIFLPIHRIHTIHQKGKIFWRK